MVVLPIAWILLGPNIPLRGFPPRVCVDPNGNIFSKLVPGNNPPGPEVLIKGNLPHCEKLPPRKGVLTHGKLNPLDILLPPG